MLSVELNNENATVTFGKNLGRCLGEGGIVFLEGSLGAGKTTLCRGILSAFGHSGAVKSPTYTLVEPYSCSGIDVFHFDLYRLGEPEELEFMGIRDYFDGNTLCLVEWPERGRGYIPSPDIAVELSPIMGGRQLSVCAKTVQGGKILAKLKEITVKK